LTVELDLNYYRIFLCPCKTVIQVSVPQRRLDSIIEEFIPHITEIYTMSLNIESEELKILKDINLNKYTPKLIIIEIITNDISINNYLIQYCYKLDKHVVYNQFYLHNSYLK
jgi:hypothetical protein